MARALSNCTSISSFFFDGISAHIQRRVYATATRTTELVRQSHKVEEKIAGSPGGKRITGSDAKRESSGSWIPDPITGYYRPVNYVANVDAAKLRKTHH